MEIGGVLEMWIGGVLRCGDWRGIRDVEIGGVLEMWRLAGY